MRLDEIISKSVHTLKQAGISTARLDTLVLLEDITGHDRAWLLAHPELEVDDKIATKLQKLIMQRAQYIPLAYIRGKTEFYGREFKVNAHTLEPRPESETMIDLLKRVMSHEPRDKSLVVGDIGCGSGALGITAALEVQNVQPVFIDIDKDALAVTKHNARTHKVKGQYYIGDLLDAWSIPYDALLCNLPYVPNDHTINEAAMQEPPHAIFGGSDGLDLYRRLFKQLKTKKCGLPVVLTESLPFQHAELRAIATQADYKETAENDFIQVFKV